MQRVVSVSTVAGQKLWTNYAGALFPSLHQCKEGRLRPQENVAKPPKPTQPGWFSFVFLIGKPPRPRDQQMLRGILLIARPPFLAVMQGGEYARLQFVHTSFDRPYSTQALLFVQSPTSLPCARGLFRSRRCFR